jgi:hypothetical protein
MSAHTDRTSRRRTLQRQQLAQLLIRRDQIGGTWAERISQAFPGWGT